MNSVYQALSLTHPTGQFDENLMEELEECDVIALAYSKILKQDNKKSHKYIPFFKEKVLRESIEESVKKFEIQKVITELDQFKVKHIIMKGTALAYSIYDHPYQRKRSDTDLLIEESAIEIAFNVFVKLGYSPHGPSVKSPFVYQRTFVKKDRFGIIHAFDLHWKVSDRVAFQNVINIDEAFNRSIALKGLHDEARGLGLKDSLLLACVHPVMHHANVAYPIWDYDVYLLTSRLNESDYEEWAALAREKGVARICASRIKDAFERFEVDSPELLLRGLESSSGGREVTEIYLKKNFKGYHRWWSDLSETKSWVARIRYMKSVLFPSREELKWRFQEAGHRNLDGMSVFSLQVKRIKVFMRSLG